MKLEFQAKFLQHLNKKKQQEEGFTLIELLVVIIIIGILAAIALPSLIAQVNKGKQAEARQNVGALNRAQQAYYLENSAFSSDIVQVGIGISTQTVNYTYTIAADDPANPQTVANIGTRVKDPGTLKSYRGLNFTTIGGVGTSTEVLALSRLCETETPNNSTGAITGGQTSCEAGFKDLGAK